MFYKRISHIIQLCNHDSYLSFSTPSALPTWNLFEVDGYEQCFITITIHGQEYYRSIYRAVAMSTVFYDIQKTERLSYNVATTTILMLLLPLLLQLFVKSWAYRIKMNEH